MGRLEEIIMPKINDIKQINIIILKGKSPLLNDLALVDVSNCLRGTPDRLPRAMREVSHKLSCGVKPGVRGWRFLRPRARAPNEGFARRPQEFLGWGEAALGSESGSGQWEWVAGAVYVAIPAPET